MEFIIVQSLKIQKYATENNTYIFKKKNNTYENETNIETIFRRLSKQLLMCIVLCKDTDDRSILSINNRYGWQG